ncbi:MAG: hypothetical protein HC892_16095 [Saprospiraceae bacterium]|nr:hypothetical protein [Saprospiraceae bacterium]
MANVITSDIYKRLFQPNATEKELMSVARITTLVVGTLVTLGALFVDRFGGAFEASKLFTSLFAVPLIIPVLFGLLFKKANSSGAILSLVFGVATGLILNFIPSISWQLATFITIVVGVFTFGFSSVWTNRSTAQQNRVDAFFLRLRTPVTLDEQSTISNDFKRALLLLFMFGLGAVGILLLVMSLPSLSDYSGQLTMIAAFCCLAITGVLYFFLPKQTSVVP